MIRTATSPAALGFTAALLFFIFSPFLLQHNAVYYRVMTMTFFYGALALAWNLYALTGNISLGHAAFFGLGAYGSALLSHYWHLAPWATVLFGGMVGAVYGLLWTVAFGCLRGARFALATLASVEIPRVIIDNWESFTFGSLGVVGITGFSAVPVGSVSIALGESLKAQYYLLLCCALVILLIHRQLIKSKWGWAVRALREEETAASMLGVNVHFTRSVTLLLSAFLTGLCGGVYAHLMGLIEPPLVFSLHISALPLVLTMFGGRYLVCGPLLGALILYPLDQVLFHSLLPVGHSILYGLIIIVTLLFFPHGIGSWVQRRRTFS